jgi:uncharacterized protein (DUF1330 family)
MSPRFCCVAVRGQQRGRGLAQHGLEWGHHSACRARGGGHRQIAVDLARSAITGPLLTAAVRGELARLGLDGGSGGNRSVTYSEKRAIWWWANDPGAVVTTDPYVAPGSDGVYYVILDVDIRDVPRYLTHMERVLPALEAAGGRYLARGGAHTVYEGTWEPARLVLMEFPSQEAWESFYHGSAYEGIKRIRAETSTGNMVGVEGLPRTGITGGGNR